MLFLTVSALRHCVLAATALFVLASCGGTPNGSATAPSTNADQTLQTTSKTPGCGPKLRNYTVGEYQLSMKGISDLPTQWQNFELIISASAVNYQTAARPFYQLHFSLFNTAVACPVSFEFGTQQVTHFKVTSLQDFDDDFPAGSDVTHLFAPTFVQNTGYYDWDLPKDLSTLLLESPMAPTSLGLTLKKAPQFAYQSFSIEIHLDDGQIFTLITDPLVFSF